MDPHSEHCVLVNNIAKGCYVLHSWQMQATKQVFEDPNRITTSTVPLRICISLQRRVVVFQRVRARVSLDLRSSHRCAQQRLASDKEIVSIRATIRSIRYANKVVEIQLKEK